MQQAIQYITSNLPGHEVAFTSRPDGKLLMTLSQDGEPIFIKALDRQIVTTETGVKELLHEILRDRKLVSGEVNWRGAGAHWLHRKLPTFSGSALNPTAAKTLWQRRGADRRRRTTA